MQDHKEDLKEVKKLISSHLGWDAFRIQRWLTQPNKRFGQCKPVDLLRAKPFEFKEAIKMCIKKKNLHEYENERD